MQDLTTGPLTRHLLKTTGLMLVTMVSQTLYLLVDLFWVGRLGREAVAGVAISGNFMLVVLAVTQMLAVGTTTLVSHATGRKDRERALLVFNQSLMLSVVASIVFIALAMAGRTRYATAMSADAATAALAADYLLWFIPASALQFAMATMAAALRGTGNFKPGVVVQTATVLLNIALAPIFIFGWGPWPALGVTGAALATFVAVALGTVWMTFYFRPGGAYLRFVPESWRPRPDLWRALLGIGLPAGAEFALMGVYLVTVYAVIRPFGAAAQAGFGIGMRIMQAGFMPVVALGIAVAAVAGQNVGAGQHARARETFRTALGMAVGTMMLFSAVCQIAPAAMIGVFSRDPRVISIGEEYLRIVSWNFVASGVVFVVSSMFQALGNTLPALASSFLRVLLVTATLVAFTRVAGFEMRWIWHLTVGAIALQMVLSLWLLRREFALRLRSPAATEA